ncbi:MAG: hypothetical protein E7311_03020 [Clostridiales bacterium]|nr:hypothetical protein [Clostridiales bacterium]
MNKEKIKDLICYTLLIFSVLVFICTYVFVKPIQLSSELEDHDMMTEESYIKEDIIEYGIENVDEVEEKYIGEIVLEKKWVYVNLLFTNYRTDFIEAYDKYNLAEDSEEKTQYEKDIYMKYGINSQEERDKLYNAFNEIYVKNNISKPEEKLTAFEQRTVIVKAEVEKDTINVIDEGINFDIKATQFDNTEIVFNCTIFNNYIEEDVFIKLLPKEITQDIVEGE